MLFDPRPKESRSEFFDREKELELLEAYAKRGSPVILCLGVRRIGKTSLLKVFLNESGYPHLYLNARRLVDYGYSIAGLYRALSEELAKIRGRFAQLLEYLKSIKGVRVGELGVELDWRGRGTSISSVLEKLNEYASDRGTSFLLVIDEAQELRFLRGRNKLDFRQLMAYGYDNLRSLKFVVSGSEVGLLYKFLDFESYESPLYGRAWDEVVLERFTREKSMEFLEVGFAEADLQVPRERLEEAVDALDGIPGWLALYGYEAVKRRRTDVLDEVLERAVGTAMSELKGLIAASQTYKHVLKAVAMGHASWSNVKRAVEAWLGAQVHNETLSRCLNKLVDMSVLIKKDGEYQFLDPVYREAAMRL